MSPDLVSLGDVCIARSSLVDPTRPEHQDLPHIAPDNVERDTGRLLAYRTVAEDRVTSGKYRFEAGDLIYSKIRPNLNKVVQVDFPGLCSADMYALDVNRTRATPAFLAHLLRSSAFLDYATTLSNRANIPKLNRDQLMSFQFALPSVGEQRRIADLLDQADLIRARRRRALMQLDTLVEAIYESRIASGASTYPVRVFADLVDETQIGLVRAAAEQGPGREHDYLRMDAITRTGRLDLSSMTRVDASPAEVGKYSVCDGDLLFNTRNTRELVGKSAVYRGEPRLYNNNLMRIRFDRRVLPDYVHRYLWSRPGQRQLETRKSGTTSVFAIYARSLATVEIPVPPLKQQLTFAKHVEHVDRLRAKMTRALDIADELFRSVQARAFSGTGTPDAA